ncbi:MAG: pitrilysin family protein [Actinomycetaceae bacterium]|nr:pitrilysin family protein [Actinomycetaceae bacterium]
MTTDKSYLHELSLPSVSANDPRATLVLDDKGLVKRSVLPGGIRVISEEMHGTRGASIGVWVPRGSRNEAEGGYGATHFLEHLLFKGTHRHTARELAYAFDQVGGESNAATSREHTHYYARVLAKDIELAVDLLMDMVTSAKLAEDDFLLERSVILDELAMSMDDPSEQIHDQFAAAVFPHHPLGRPVGGTKQTVEDITLQAVREHFRLGYTPNQVVIAGAGALEHQSLCDLVLNSVERAKTAGGAWESWQTALDADTLSLGFPESFPGGIAARPQAADKRNIHMPVEQTHIICGGPGLEVTSPLRPVSSVLETILGGGMSSRLFQTVREERGLAYTTYSFSSAYHDTGLFGMYAACAPHHAGEVSQLMRAQLELLATVPVDDSELNRAKGQLRGSVLLGMEDTGARMSRLGAAEIIVGKYKPLDTSLSQIDAVTAQDIKDLATRYVQDAGTEVWLGSVEQ